MLSENSNHRFGDFRIHPKHSHLVVSILEDHTKPAPADVVTTLVVVNTKTQALTTIAQGSDFYSTPRFSPNGEKISWIQWDHPDMPWEGSEVVVASFAVGESDKATVTDVQVIAGKHDQESITGSNWVSDDALVFMSDKSGFWNPWKYDVQKKSANPVLHSSVNEEYGEPAWLLGMSRSSAMDASTVLVSPTDNGVIYLALLDVHTGTLAKIQSPYVNIGSIHAVSDTEAVFVGVKDDAASALILLTLPSKASTALTSGTIHASFSTLKETSSLAATLPSSIFPTHQPIVLKIQPNDAPLHVVYYPPTNPEYSGGKDNELPPCITRIHGGPTGRVSPGLSWVASYYTSRGWAWYVSFLRIIHTRPMS